MFNNPYINSYGNNIPQMYNQQSLGDDYIKSIEKEEELLKKRKENYLNRMQQPTAINQTFQLSPNGVGIKYANSIEDVTKEAVFVDTPFFSKDLSVLWIKNARGDIKAYELNEIVEKDEKDMEIELLKSEIDERDSQLSSLKSQINELRGMINNEQYTTNVIQPKNETNTTGDDATTRTTTKSKKSTSVSRVSTSKEK